MKKILYILIVLLIVPFAMMAQSQRMVLAEECTNASCGPCAAQNPAFDALLQANEDLITSIKYHTSWPGTDPMYSHNTSQNSARTSYYNVSGVPHAVIDGEPTTGSSYTGAPANLTQQKIENAAAVPSPFELQFHHELSPDNDSIYLTMIIEATEDVSGDLLAHMAVIEKHIHFNNPPGSNGERDFYNVMKYMVPSVNGTSLPDFVDGEYIIIEGAWELDNVYDINELAAVGFIQNDISKDVHQAVNSTENALTPLYTYDAQSVEVKNVTDANCSGTTTPVVVIRNNGAEVLTSLDINYSVNGGEVHTFNWTGNLDFLEKQQVELPEVVFTVEEENELLIETLNPNGQQDEYVLNDQYNFAFNQAVQSAEMVTLSMRLDDNPEETSWEVVNSEGEIMYSGGDYTSPGQFIQEDLNFDAEDCYTFIIYDEAGNGFGTGGFITLRAGSDVIIQATNFGSELSNVFEIVGYVSVEEGISAKEIQLYPNPVSSNLYLKVPEGATGDYMLMDLSGKEILGNSFENLSGDVQIDLSGFNNGIYLITVRSNGEVVNRKITVAK